MKKTICSTFATAIILLSACTNETEGLEHIQVSFNPVIPESTLSRNASDNYTSYYVTCTVYDVTNPNEKTEITSQKQKIAYGNSYKPTLVKGRDYEVVCFAAIDNAYDISEFPVIKYATTNVCNNSSRDAFAGVYKQEKVQDNATYPITLIRPLAQLNVAASETDWENVTESHSMIPTQTEVTITGCPESYNIWTGKSSSTTTNVTFSCSDIPKETLTVGNTKYHYLAMNYLFPFTEEDKKVSSTVTVYETPNQKICDITTNDVPLSKNQRTNIVGNLMTGTVTYTISIDGSWND